MSQQSGADSVNEQCVQIHKHYCLKEDFLHETVVRHAHAGNIGRPVS
jgi:hypothetical protein